MGFALSPGVNVSEVDLTGYIPAVATTGGATVGRFEWGPVEEYKTISNKKQFEKWFGKPSDENYVDWYSAVNFLGYSNTLNTIRVVEATALNSSADGAGILIKNTEQLGLVKGTPAGDTAMIAARYAGVKGDSITISMADADTFASWDSNYSELFDTAPGTSKYVADLGGANDELHIVVVDSGGEFTGVVGAILETYAYVSKASDAKTEDNAPNFYGDVLNKRSEFVWFLEVPETADYAVGGAISSITVDSAGQDYTVAPTVNITGDGTGATATAVLNPTGGIASITVTGGGTGYTVGDTIVINGDGNGATAEVGSETGGVIDTITVLTAGSGYTTATVDATGSGGGDATATADVGYGVASITVDVAGQDYTTATVDITGDGSGATATAVIGADASYDSAWNTKALNSKYLSLATDWTKLMAGGNDGGVVTSDELIVGWDMFKNSEVVDVSLLFVGDAGGDASHTAVVKHVVDNIAEFRKDCVAFFSPLQGDVVGQPETTAVANAIATRQAINTVSSYAVMDSGWKYQYDYHNDKLRWVPLNADMAGLCAKTDDLTDPWYSPAGFNRGQIKNVIQLALNPSKGSRDELYKKGVNPVVSFAGEGVLLYGDRTQQARPSAFQKINVRRLFIVLEKAIATAAKYQLFEFNDSFTRSQFKNMVEPFLREVRGRRGIYDFEVVCDERNNTPEVIDRSEFVADIYIKPTYSINFIQLNFIAVRTGVEFEEIIGGDSLSQEINV